MRAPHDQRFLDAHRAQQEREADRWYRNLLDAVRREAHRKTPRRQERSTR